MSDRSFLEPGLEEPMVAVEGAPEERLPPGRWVRRHLFNNWYNTLLTILLLVGLGYAGYRFFSFLFVTGRWDPVTENLTLFMVGRFPREELWRVVAQVLIWSGGLGLAWGAAVSGARFRAAQAGMPYREDPVLAKVRRYWGLVGLLVLVLLLTRTIGPLLLTVAALGVGALLQAVGARVPGRHADLMWALVGVLGVAGYQIVSGFHGNGWLWMSLPVAFGVVRLLRRRDWSNPRRERRVVMLTVAGVLAVAYLTYSALDLEGVGWDKWEGLRLNLIVAALAIVLSFPLGLLLALARRSSFPALRIISTGYIELIRGVPLISLLLMGQFFLGFFLNTSTPLSDLTRAISAFTLFTAAYVAEIVRGGLQGVPSGQVEAGQSVGLSPVGVTRLIVLPQALRAVIPAMVGQFIALFKDTSLLYIIATAELLRVRALVHAQAEFRGFGIAETLVFVMLAFWAFSFTMSRESQRLERRLGIGER
ncbi:MAG TPA: amino acid ABC transporter permease [Acidimicrobiia bacterium]|nr:amino acid ABC transporter permease [Acidimicrobiia bacterium]